MREDVEAYEDAVRKQVALAEQARLKEQAAKDLDNKAKSIKGQASGMFLKNPTLQQSFRICLKFFIRKFYRRFLSIDFLLKREFTGGK